MNSAAQALEDVTVDTNSADLMFIEDSSLEFVGGGTITNTL